MTASVTHGRALRYAKGSARGLLHHHPGHCPTLHHATRAMVLQIEIDEESEPSIREVLHCSIEELKPLLREGGGKWYLPVNRAQAGRGAATRNLAELKPIASTTWKHLQVVQLENGTILVKQGDSILPQAKPSLREIAREIGVDVLNQMGNPKNTRTLGSDIIKALG